MTFSAQLRADQERIDHALAEYAAQWPDHGPLRQAMTYSLMAGGKRIRPVLTLAFCRLFGGTEEAALPLACGLEMVHTYSLIHDDLPCMDDDDFRRGKPTNHKVYGQANAVLAGDALLTAAFSTLAEAPLPPDQICRAVRILAYAAGPDGMVGGQVLDLLGEGSSLSEEEILTIEALKTGCMIEAAARLGAVAAGGTPEQEEAAAAYARPIGLAFQIRDDVLDVLGDAGELGKATGADSARQKSTFVALKGLEACQTWIDTLTEQALQALEPFAQKDFLSGLARFLAGRTT